MIKLNVNKYSISIDKRVMLSNYYMPLKFNKCVISIPQN